MYLLIISYTQHPDVVAEQRATHLAWVEKYVAEGVFLAAGPKTSKLGGAILARSIDKNRLKEIIAEDSFVKADVADYNIIEVAINMTAAGLEQLTQA